MKLGADVVYEKMYDVHVSGHACQEELKMMISLSDSLTYTKPLETISGPASMQPELLRTVAATIISPSSARCFLSLNTTEPIAAVYVGDDLSSLARYVLDFGAVYCSGGGLCHR